MKTYYNGKNLYRTFLKAGKIISGKIARQEGVVGILGTGSIGRKFGDKSSDLDLLVYAEKEHIRRLEKLVSIGWTGYRGMDYDILVINYDKAMRARVPSKIWNQIRRWDLQNSQILFDSKDRIKMMLSRKLVYPDSERESLMEKYKMRIHEHLVFFPEMWAERGNLYNVIDTLCRAVQNMILWIYAKNRLFEPYIEKWLFYHLETNAIAESRYLQKLTEIYTTRSRDIEDMMRIRSDLLKICHEIGLTFEVYSFEEARERTRKNWKKLSDDSKEVLSW